MAVYLNGQLVKPAPPETRIDVRVTKDGHCDLDMSGEDMRFTGSGITVLAGDKYWSEQDNDWRDIEDA